MSALKRLDNPSEFLVNERQINVGLHIPYTKSQFIIKLAMTYSKVRDYQSTKNKPIQNKQTFKDKNCNLILWGSLWSTWSSTTR